MRLTARAARAVRLIRAFANLDRADVLLASFPRSGNTWLRFVLANVISLSECDGQEVDFHLLREMMPQMGLSDLSKPWTYRTLPRIVKTHQRYHAPFRGLPVILVVRDPRDSMVSYFNYMRGKEEIDPGLAFDAFVRGKAFGLEVWFRHWASWQGRYSLLLRYEDLRRDTPSEIRKLLDLAGSKAADAVVEEAIRRSEIGRIKKIEAESDPPLTTEHGPAFRFVRDGASRQWVDSFTPGLLDLYERLRKRHAFDLYE